jgi:LysM repeat protein
MIVGGHLVGSRVLCLWLFGLCFLVMLTASGCSREKPMSTPTVTLEPQAAVEPTPTSPPLSTPAAPEPTYYTVQAGDTLWAIASRFGVAVEALVEANKPLEPDRLQPGQELTIPLNVDDVVADEPSPQPARTPESRRIHTVIAGDTLWSVAQRYGTTVGEIARLNNLDPNQFLTLDQQLLIP